VTQADKGGDVVAASGPTIWTSMNELEPVLCNKLLIEPYGWVQTVHTLLQRLTYHVTQYPRRSLNAFCISRLSLHLFTTSQTLIYFYRQ